MAAAAKWRLERAGEGICSKYGRRTGTNVPAGCWGVSGPGQAGGGGAGLHELLRDVGRVDVAVHVRVQRVVAPVQLPCNNAPGFGLIAACSPAAPCPHKAALSSLQGYLGDRDLGGRQPQLHARHSQLFLCWLCKVHAGK